jgi:hypothetical protein
MVQVVGAGNVNNNGRNRWWLSRPRIRLLLLLLGGGFLAMSIIIMVLVLFVSGVFPPSATFFTATTNNNKKQQPQRTLPPPPLFFQTTPPMVLMVRMSGTLAVHRYRFLCTLLRSTVLFWNEAYSSTLVLVLDDELESDHDFGEAVSQQLLHHEFLPDWNVHLQVRYEKLPTNLDILSNQTGLEKQRPGYKRQLYSSFWSDTFVTDVQRRRMVDHKKNDGHGEGDRDSDVDDDDDESDDEDTLLVFLDVDAMFLSPVTGPSIFDDVEEDDPVIARMMRKTNNTSKQQQYRQAHDQQQFLTKYRRPRIYGANCSFGKDIVEKWRMTTRMAIGFPMVADFMTTFPVYIYASTIRNCRQFILQRMGTSNMEDAFAWLNPPTFAMSPICILLNYAWYYERHRYSWSFQICNNDWVDDSKHKMIPPQDRIVIEEEDNDGIRTIRSNVHIGQGTPWPQTAFHQPYARHLTNTTLEASYCLASRALVNLQEELLRHEVKITTTAAGSLMGDRSASGGRGSAASDGVASPLFDLPRQCQDKRYDWKDNFVLFHHDLQRVHLRPPPCDGTESFCTDRLQQHYQAYAQEVLGIDPRPRKPNQHQSSPPLPLRRPVMDWSRITKVEELAAKHWATTCPPITSIYV